MWFRQQIAHGSFIHFSLGWIKAGDNQLVFWLKNTGLVLPLAAIGIFLLPKKYRLFFVPPVLLFAAANLVIFQPWDWDNIKLFSWAFLFLAIPAGHTLANLFARRFLIKIVALIIIVSLTASGLLSLTRQAQGTFTIYDTEDIKLVEWVKANTKPTDVFLIDPWPNHPVPGLAGRSVYVGYPGHLWVHGIDYGRREELTKQILAGDWGKIKETGIPIDYVVTTSSDDIPAVPWLTLIFQNGKFMVYRVNK